MSRSSDVVAWARTRLPATTFAPLALLLLLAGLVGGGPPVALADAKLTGAFALAALLTVDLRLVDDLTDLVHDRVAHPERALCRARDLRPFVALLLVLLVASAALTWALTDPARALGWIALHAGLLMLSRARGSARHLLVLAKYPAVVVLLAGVRPAVDPVSLAATAAATWLAFAAHEVLHDPALRAARWTSVALALELTLLACAPLVGTASVKASVGTVLAGGVAVWLWRRHRLQIAPGAWCRVVFAAALPALLSSMFPRDPS